MKTNALMLDEKGIIAAIGLGILYILTDGFKALFIVTLFLFIGNVVTKYGKKKKKKLKMAEYSRTWKNVISNGFIPLIFLFLSAKEDLNLFCFLEEEMIM